VFHNGSGTKNRFQQLWKYKFFKHRKLPYITFLHEAHIQLQWENIFPLHLLLFFLLQLNVFPLRLRYQRSANKIRPDGAPSFIGNLKSLLKLDNFWLSEFHNGSGRKNRFQQLWMYRIFKHRKLPFIPCLMFGETHIKLRWHDTTFFFHIFSFCNATFFYSGYVIKPPQPTSAFYRAPPFTGHLTTCIKCNLLDGYLQ